MTAIRLVVGRVQYLLDGRLFEWTFSAGAFWLAVETLFYPASIVDGAFKQLTETMSPTLVSAYALAVALTGMGALATNGLSLVWGPTIRSICATCRAYLWAQMAYALYLLGLTQPTPSVGLGFWALFALAELYVAFRAMADVRRAV